MSSLAVPNRNNKILKTENSVPAPATARVFTMKINEKSSAAPSVTPRQPPSQQQIDPNRMSLKMNKSENFQKHDLASAHHTTAAAAAESSMASNGSTPLGAPSISVDNTGKSYETNTINRDINMEQLNSSITLASSQLSSTNSSRVHSPNKKELANKNVANKK
jgi:hypothetical protein